MIGVGRTVFQGADLADFKVHIIGVLRNVQGPRRNLILARLEGGPLAQTGVAAGMSGSPVYVDGRLIGAVSYSIGAFSKEAIAGITPIQEMKDATATSRPRPVRQARVDLPVTRQSLTEALTAAYAQLAPFAARPADVQSIGLPTAAGAQLGAMMRPIATPLLMAGFEPDIADVIGGGFRDSGFSPVITGGIRGRRRSSDRPAARGRRDRRVADRRRPRDGRHRHRHAHRRRPRLRLRASLLQSRPRRISDDPRARVHHAPQPDELVQDLQPRRDHRDDAAGSRDGDCGNAGEGTGAGADDHHRQLHPRRRRAADQPHREAEPRQRPAVHAAPRLRLDVQYAGLVRAPVRRGDHLGEEPGAPQGPRRPDPRGCVRDRESDPRRLCGGGRAVDA